MVLGEGIVHKCDVIIVCERYYEIYVLELCQLFAADLYAELFEPTLLRTAQKSVWYCIGIGIGIGIYLHSINLY